MPFICSIRRNKLFFAPQVVPPRCEITLILFSCTGVQKIVIHKDGGVVKIRAYNGPNEKDKIGDAVAEVYMPARQGEIVHFIAHYKVGHDKCELVVSPNGGSGATGAGGRVIVDFFTQSNKGATKTVESAAFDTPHQDSN